MADSSADIGIRIFLDDAAFNALYGINSELGSMASLAEQAGLGFGDMSEAMTGLAVVAGLAVSFAAFAGGIGLAVKNAVDMQTLLIQIQRATNGTNQQMQQMQQTMMTLGGNSIFSLQQIAAGFVLLGQRGITAQEIINGVGQAGVDLAEATGTMPVDAMGLLASTIASFNIPAQDAMKTADLLQFAFEHGVPSVSEMTSGLSRLGSISSTLHISLQDVIPAFDIMSRAMGSGSLAATSLYYFLNQVKSGTGPFKAEIAHLGISFYDAKGNFIGLNQSLELLFNTLKNKTPKEQAQILADMFNIRSSQGIGILMQDMSQLENLTNQLAASNGNAGMTALRAGQMANSAGGLWAGLQTNIQDILGLIGQPFLAQFQPVLKVLDDMSKSLRQFAYDHPQVLGAFLAIGAVVSGLGLLVAIGTSAFGPFLGIMALVIVGVVGITAGIMWLIANWKNLTSASSPIAPILNALLPIFQQLGRIIKELAPQVGQYFVAAWKGLQAVFKDLTPTFKSIGEFMMHTILPALAGFHPHLPTIKQLGDLFQTHVMPIIRAVTPFFQHLGVVIQQIGAYAAQQFGPAWKQFVAAIQPVLPLLKELAMAVGTILFFALGLVIAAIHGLIGLLAGLLQGLGFLITGIVMFVTGVLNFVVGFFKILIGIFTLNGNVLKEGWNQMWHGVLEILGGIVYAIVGVIVGLVKGLAGLWQGLISGTINFFQNLFDKLVGHSIIPEMMQAILNTVIGFVPHILDAFGGLVTNLISNAEQLPGKILNALGNVGSVLFNAGQMILQGFINGLNSMVGNLTQSVTGILNNIRNFFPHSPVKEGPLMDFQQWMPNLIHMMADSTDRAAPSLQASMSRVAGGVQTGLMSGMGNAAMRGGNAGGETYNLMLDGKAVMSFFHNQLTGDLSANGLGRMQR